MNRSQEYLRAAAGGHERITGASTTLAHLVRRRENRDWLEHPPAHFHAEYGEYEITVDIDSGVVTGRFPRRALNAVLEWYELHRDELAENWQRSRQELLLRRIE